MVQKILAVTVEDEPKILPEMGRALSEANVEVEAIAVAPQRDGHKALMITSDTDRAFETLRTEGFMVERITGLTLLINKEPGELARVLQDMVDAGVDISCVLTTRESHVVVGVDDVDKAREAAEGFAAPAQETGGATGAPAS